MDLPRKSLLPLALIVGLFGTTLGSAYAQRAPSGVAHPPVVQLATADPAIGRRRRRIRGRKVRGILSRLAARVRGAAGRTRPAGKRIRTRRAHRDRLARGPPLSPAL
jgi:hypothetical protein